MARSFAIDSMTALVFAKDGAFLVNRNDFYIGKSIEIYGEHGGLESAFLQSLVSEGDNVIEVGANIGSHTVGLAKAVGSRGKVFAFEPQRACFALLQAQIALNRLGNIYANLEGVGSSKGRLWMPPVDYTKQGNFGAVSMLAEEIPGAEALDVVVLDEKFGGIPCALIKIDVEGMEAEVIKGGVNLIRKQRPLLYVENDRLEKSKSLVSLLLDLGYRLWWHIPRLYNPNNYFGINENIYGAVSSFNMFCCPGNHASAAGLIEIKSPDDPHPLAIHAKNA